MNNQYFIFCSKSDENWQVIDCVESLSQIKKSCKRHRRRWRDFHNHWENNTTYSISYGYNSSGNLSEPLDLIELD